MYRTGVKKTAQKVLATLERSCSSANAFREIALERRSCQRFEPNLSIPVPTMIDILEVTLTTPSGFNIQPTQIVVVTDPHVKENLAKNAMLGKGNQFKANDCSALAVFLSDLEIHKRIPRILELEANSGVRDANYLAGLPVVTSFLTGEGHLATLLKQASSSFMSTIQPAPTIDDVRVWSYKNSAMAAQMYTMTATSHGLATCMMEGYDSRRVSDILRLPENGRYGIPVMVATGFAYRNPDDVKSEGEEKSGEPPYPAVSDSRSYPAVSDSRSHRASRTPRLPLEDVVFSDLFGEVFCHNNL